VQELVQVRRVQEQEREDHATSSAEREEALRLQCQSASAENTRLHARGERVQQQASEAVAAWQRRLQEAQELESEYQLLQEKHRDLIERSCFLPRCLFATLIR
jgi:hypothetical protein